jgi:hypothetical protein
MAGCDLAVVRRGALSAPTSDAIRMDCVAFNSLLRAGYAKHYRVFDSEVR